MTRKEAIKHLRRGLDRNLEVYNYPVGFISDVLSIKPPTPNEPHLITSIRSKLAIVEEFYIPYPVVVELLDFIMKE